MLDTVTAISAMGLATMPSHFVKPELADLVAKFHEARLAIWIADSRIVTAQSTNVMTALAASNPMAAKLSTQNIATFTEQP